MVAQNGSRHVGSVIALCFLPTVCGCDFWMPRCSSYFRVLADGGVLSDAQRARRERDEKFKQLPQSDLSFSGLPQELKSPLTRMFNGRLLHQELADSTGCSSPSGKVCAHVALKQGVLDRSMYQSVRMRLEHAVGICWDTLGYGTICWEMLGCWDCWDMLVYAGIW